jgi:hypothetical protein
MSTQTTNNFVVETNQKVKPKRMIKFLALAFTTLFAFAVSVTPSGAQTLFGSVVGTVTDASGAAVVGATVTVVSAQTNDTRSAQTNDRGEYTLSTVSVGTYKVSIAKQGFQSYSQSGVGVTANNVSRIDAQLQVGSVNQTVEVNTTAVQLQTDTAEVHTEISDVALQNVPQPSRTYEGVLNLVPGIAAPTGGATGQGTNNPARSFQFAANGTSTSGPNVRIDGVSATNQWEQFYTTFVPSTEAIQSVNVVTNSPDAEQGLSGGPAVTVQLKSGSNSFHGSAYELNITNFGEARGFFQLVGAKPSHIVDNDFGATVGGPLIKDKLFYFGSYEGDRTRQGFGGVVSIPTPTMLSGNMFAAGDNTNGVVTSANQLYDPASGNPDGTGKTAFTGNVIPAGRINPIIAKQIIPDILADDQPNTGGTGAIQNNLFANQNNAYNLHKIDTKVDYIATSKLRVSGRFSKQPYKSLLNPIFGIPLGGTSNNWPAFQGTGNGNYYEHGAILAISGSATYVFSPSLVADATFGVTDAHQWLIPYDPTENWGAELGIPGTAQSTQKFFDGGFPDLAITNYGGSTGAGTFGYSYPPMEYKDPTFEYVGNVTKTHGAHSFRAGVDFINLHMNHDEIRQTIFEFTGAGTTAPGQNPNAYNSVADFLLGAVFNESTWVMWDDILRMYEKDIALYARDQWQVSRKLTLNYGVRWEFYPVPNRGPRGIEYNNVLTNPANNTMELCGVGTEPGDCGLQISHRLFAPSLGIAYRPFDKWVVRTGGSISPQQNEMGQALTQNFPAEQEYVANGANSYTLAGNLSAGFPTLTKPVFSSAGTVVIPPGTSNMTTTQKNFKRGYVASYNLMIERELPWGAVGDAGYVGTHVIDELGSYNYNYGTLGGGAASQPLNTAALKVTGTANVFEPLGNENYNSLQASLNKPLSHGFSAKVAYTWSRDMLTSFANGILIPQYKYRDHAVASSDRTNNFIVTGLYEFPFGQNKAMLTHGVGAQVLGGWSLTSTFSHLSGTPFNVTASSASCNCPGNTQRANQVGNITKVGRGVFGQPYYNPLAFAQPTTAAFGSASYDDIRGPGYTNLDTSLARDFHVWEGIHLMIRADAFNIMNHAHFANPGATLSNLVTNADGSVKSLNGYDTISSTAPLGRTIDQRYFRLGGHLSW